MPAPVRRVPSVVAGVVALAASLSALAAVVWSDFAEASQQPAPVEYADELPEFVPVKVQKVEHAVNDDLLDLVDELERQQAERPRIKFGKFEGY